MLSRTARRLPPGASRASRLCRTPSPQTAPPNWGDVEDAHGAALTGWSVEWNKTNAEFKASSSRNVEDDTSRRDPATARSAWSASRGTGSARVPHHEGDGGSCSRRRAIRHEVGVLRRVGMHLRDRAGGPTHYFESPTHHYIVMDTSTAAAPSTTWRRRARAPRRTRRPLQRSRARWRCSTRRSCATPTSSPRICCSRVTVAQARRLWALDAGEEGRGAADEGHVGQLAARGLLQVVRRHARRRHVGDRRRRVHHARRLPPLRLRRRRHRHAGARAIPARNSPRAIPRAISDVAGVPHRSNGGSWRAPSTSRTRREGRPPPAASSRCGRARPRASSHARGAAGRTAGTAEAGGRPEARRPRPWRRPLHQGLPDGSPPCCSNNATTRWTRPRAASSEGLGAREGCSRVDLLARAFGAFDLRQRGDITEADLQRVLQRTPLGCATRTRTR